MVRRSLPAPPGRSPRLAAGRTHAVVGQNRVPPVARTDRRRRGYTCRPCQSPGAGPTLEGRATAALVVSVPPGGHSLHARRGRRRATSPPTRRLAQLDGGTRPCVSPGTAVRSVRRQIVALEATARRDRHLLGRRRLHRRRRPDALSARAAFSDRRRGTTVGRQSPSPAAARRGERAVSSAPAIRRPSSTRRWLRRILVL